MAVSGQLRDFFADLQQVAGAAIATSQAGALSAQLAFSRDFEREADRRGFDILRNRASAKLPADERFEMNMGDIAERALWAKYQAAYQDMIHHTSTKHAPWHIVPADHKWFARVVIGSAIVAALDKLDLQFPKVDKADKSEFRQVRQALLDEDGKAPKSGAGKAK